MTLVDLIVAWIVGLALVSVIATAYSVGLIVMRPSGPAGVAAGAHDQETFEQYVGQDFARASCVMDPAGGRAYGSCGQASVFQSPGVFGKIQTQCTGTALLCIGWPTVTDSYCHGAVYTISSGAVARVEYVAKPSAGGASQLSYTDLTSGRGTSSSKVTVSVSYATVTVTPAPGSLNAGVTSYSWLSGATLTVRSSVAADPQAGSLNVRTHVVDPAGPSALLSSSGGLIC